MGVCTAKGCRWRPQTSPVFIAPDSPPQRRNPGVSGKAIYNGKEQLLGRAHLARQYASCGQSSLGARLRTRKVTGRDASLPAPLLSAFRCWSPVELLGRCPKPHKGRCPLTLQGTLSLDPFLAPRLERASHAVSCRGFLPFSPLPYWNKDIISCGDSPPTMDSPGLISWSNSAFFRCPSATTCSSIEACVTRRITSTLRVCPMRYARSVA